MKELNKGLGIWQLLTSEIITDIIATSGFDFAILDLEHGLHNPQTIQNCLFSAKSSGINLIARIPSLSYPYIVQVIESGVDGILFPHIETNNQLEHAINNTFLHPLGSRSFSPFVPRFDYGSSKSRFCKDPLLGILLESEKGLQNSDILLSNPNVDFAYFGAYDLSLELGLSGDIFADDLVERLTSLTECAISNNKKIMAIYRNEEELNKLFNIGVHFPIASVDTFNLHFRLTQIVNIYNKINN
tara:strand:- start:29 stop:760 length:732 start_codon:yes stop_codon:yes gene_type:complete